MVQELDALERNKTWEVVDLLKGKKAIGCRWVFKIKLKADASSYGWLVQQVDINNAFLHGFLNEDIYMHAPDGYLVQPGQLSSHSSVPLSDPEPYRFLVGRLLYLSFTLPDMSFGAQQLSQFVHAPCKHHMEAALHLVCYLKGCPECGLFFPVSNSFTISAYYDADWASCADS
ncbi:uncharacterized protein LOC105168619 [Sesamum indicum]|uniref:Uncharacterized protein LOC105168619 n=1 Tax=Sesamum indicum TaxID=4182 RepID=A0A6I9TZU7_SESIN|nr:uncharacterized protein LOC105168619 [Sesamum indicum]